MQRNHNSKVTLVFFYVVHLPCIYNVIPKFFFQDYIYNMHYYIYNQMRKSNEEKGVIS